MPALAPSDRKRRRREYGGQRRVGNGMTYALLVHAPESTAPSRRTLPQAAQCGLRCKRAGWNNHNTITGANRAPSQLAGDGLLGPPKLFCTLRG